jgi:hypothetical protein
VEIEELLIQIKAENKELISQMKSSQDTVAKAANKMGSAVETFAKDGSKSAFSFQRAFETAVGFIGGQLVIGAFNRAMGAAQGFFRSLIVDGVAAAQVQEDAINQLNQALGRSGKFSKEASQELQEFASSLQAASTFGDEAILSNMALIQSLGNLSKDGLKEATQAAVDMAAALNMDLSTASNLVARAAAGNTTAFSRYGIVIKEGTDATETFANTLRALNDNFGGAAEAQIKTFSGAMQQLKNTYGDLTEEVGFIITKNQSLINTFIGLGNMIGNTSDDIKDNREAMSQLVSQGIIITIDVMERLIRTFDAFARVGEFATSAVMAGFQKLNIIGQSLFKTLGITSQETLDQLKKEFEATSMVMNEAFTRTTFAEDLANQLNQVGQSAREGFGQMSDAADHANNALKELQEQQAIMDEEALKRAEQGKVLAENLIMQLEDENEQKIILLQEQLERENELLQNAFDQRLISEDQFNEAKDRLRERDKEREKKKQEELKAFETKMMQDKLRATATMFSGLASLSAQGGRRSFQATKALSMAEAVTVGALGVQRAIAAPPGPPWNAMIVAGTIAQTMANVMRIRNQSPPSFASGIDRVPGLPAFSMPAVLHGGERVVPQKTNQDLTGFLKEMRSGGMGEQRLHVVLEMKDQLMDFIEAKLVERGRLATTVIA